MSDEVIDGVYHPPEGVYFRLHNRSWDYCIFARDHESPHTGTVWSQTTPYQDQYFTLVRHGKYWALKNKRTGKYLEAYIGKENDWAYHNASKTEKTALRLVKPSKNVSDLEGCFEVIFHTAIGPQNSLEGWLRCNNDGFWTPEYKGPHVEDGDQQFWSMEFEDMEIDDIEWKMEGKKTFNVQDVGLGHNKIFRNATSEKQSFEFQQKETVVHTSQFTRGFGVSAKVTYEAKVKIPEFVEGGSKAEYGAEAHFSWNTVDTTTKEHSVSDKITVGPWKKVEAHMSATKGNVKVPIVVTYKSRSTGQKCKAWGEWKGTISWDAETYVQESPLSQEGK